MDNKKPSNTDSKKENIKQADEVIPPNTPLVDVARMVSESTATRAVIGYTADGKPLALEMRGGVLVGVVGQEEIGNAEKPSK